MILIDKMKNMKLYRTSTFLPTLPSNKKKESAVILLTPNYNASKNMMNHPLFVNNKRFESYYMERDIAYYIGKKYLEDIEESTVLFEDYFTETKRSNLPDSEFGIPEDRKYPLDTEQHIRSAIHLFGHAEESKKKSLARKIASKAKSYGIKIEPTTQVYKYLHEDESTHADHSHLKYIIFDIGGVLVEGENPTDNLLDAGIPAYYIKDFIEIFYNKMKGSAENATIDDARIAFNALCTDDEMRSYADKAFEICCTSLHQCDYDDKILSLLKSKGYHLYYLSNWSKYSFELCKMMGKMDFLKYFEDGIVSYEVGFRKPDKSIYEIFKAHFDIDDPSACLFLDDKDENTKAARACGMNAATWDQVEGPSYILNNFVIDAFNEFIYNDILIKDGRFDTETNEIVLTVNNEASDEFRVSMSDLIAEMDEMMVNEAVEDGHKYYLVSDNYLGDNKKIKPGIPKGAVDEKTERIRFYNSVNGALIAKGEKEINEGRELFVHVPVDEDGIKITTPSTAQVPNANITGEVWCKEITTVKCIGKIRVGKPLKTYTYKVGDKDVEAHSWNYSWLTSQDKHVVENVEEEPYRDLYLAENAVGQFDEAINTGDYLMIFGEDAKTDPILQKYLFQDRLKTRKDLVNYYEMVKRDNAWLKYTYPELGRYVKRNIFYDTSYYTNLFFTNNTWVMQRGLNLYIDFVKKALNLKGLKDAGYTRFTIMVPIHEWDKYNDGMIWNYRKNINPMSVMYHYLFSGALRQLKPIFGDVDILFVGKDKYFKMNFSEIAEKDAKNVAAKFRLFLTKICKGEPFDPEDVDTSADEKDDSDVIAAKIVDKVEDARGVDLTPQVAYAKKNREKNPGKQPVEKPETPATTSDGPVSKATLNQPEDPEIASKEKNKQELANRIVDASDNTGDEDTAIDALDDAKTKALILDLDNEDDGLNLTAGRITRMNQLNDKFLQSNVKGQTVRDILADTKGKEEVKTKLNIGTPYDDWEDLSFVNFDKNYNIDKDILACFYHLQNVSRPISIRGIDVKDNSTSEDRVELYTVNMEDYRGKQFTAKLDIPIMEDNRFLLRGNYKSIKSQFFNMPILKTEEDTVQIISNYMKIFVRRFRGGNGRSMPMTTRTLKAVKKYTGDKMTYALGDNTKICSKYQLPIDYIDFASELSYIETSKYKIYFNQDEIRKHYDINEKAGIPLAYNKSQKMVEYLQGEFTCTDKIINMLDESLNFREMVQEAKAPSVCTYSRASILNSQIPLVIICAYHVGLRSTMDRAHINYQIVDRLTKEDRNNIYRDWIQFEDGYVVYDVTYESSLLMNGLKECNMKEYKLEDIDNRNMYLELLDNFGGRIKADGLENFRDLMIDPMTKETLEFYHLPTDYIDILIYANNLLADNKFIKHTDTSSRRLRRYQLIAAYTYKALADAYYNYAIQLKHTESAATFMIKQSAVIDRFLTDTISSDDSVINALRDLETTNEVTTKGPSGMNADRAYSLDKRTYDESMLNVIGMSTGFASNVGITRQATLNANITPEGYVKSIHGDTSKMNTSNTLTATEAITPFGSTHDDPMRTAMTFIQTSKHQVRTVESDPLLVTNGSDEALPYMSSDRFAYKAKKKGKVLELTDNYIILEYTDGTKDYINLEERIEKNSDGGYYVPLKLDKVDKLRENMTVQPGEIIAYDRESYSNSLGENDHLAYNVGKLAKVAIVNTDEGFEDSGVISQALAEKLATRIDYKFDTVLDKDTIIYSIAKVGDHVEAGQPLMIYQSPFDDEDANKLMTIMADGEVSDLGKRKLKSEVTGTVTAIKMFRTVELSEMSDSLKKVVKEYEKPYKELSKKLDEYGINKSKVPAHYVLAPTGKLKKAVGAVLIEIYVEYLDTVGIGDKVVYYSANKAVEKDIFPVGKEPYTAYRPNEKIDAFVSETSIAKRMVCSTLTIGSLNKMMIELDRHVKDIMGIDYDDSKV